MTPEQLAIKVATLSVREFREFATHFARLTGNDRDDNEPFTGVREPRRPKPDSGAGAIDADAEDRSVRGRTL